METKLIFAKVQRALRSIFHGGQSKLSTEDTESTVRWELDGIILGSLRLEILEEIFVKNGRGPEIIMDPRRTRRTRIIGNLSTEDTEGTDHRIVFVKP